MLNLFKNKMRALVIGLMLIGTLGTATTVSAATVWPTVGGEWNYGVGVTGSYSDYMHPTRIHTATVDHPESVPSMGRAVGGQWAKARLWQYSGCSFYYGVE